MIEAELKGRVGNQLFIALCVLGIAMPRNEHVIIYNITDQWLRDGIKAVYPNCTLFQRTRADVLQQQPQRRVPTDVTTETSPLAFTPIPARNGTNNTLVKGYRQNFAYFANVWSAALAQKLLSTCRRLAPLTRDTVAVHVRRGDYSGLQHILPLLGDSYYVSALNTHFQNKAGRIVVFAEPRDRADVRASFVPAIAKECKWAQQISVFDDNSLAAHEEMAHMSTADMLVIANSTYSWWAGLLAVTRNPKAKVVAPSVWFGAGVPFEWQREPSELPAGFTVCSTSRAVVVPVDIKVQNARAIDLMPEVEKVLNPSCSSWPTRAVFFSECRPSLRLDMTYLTPSKECVFLVPQIVVVSDVVDWPCDDIIVQRLTTREHACRPTLDDRATWITFVSDKRVALSHLYLDLWQIMRTPGLQKYQFLQKDTDPPFGTLHGAFMRHQKL